MPQLFNLLEHVYSVVDKETAYEAKFNELAQESTPFNVFVAEFYRLSAPLGMTERQLLRELRRKVTRQLYMALADKRDLSLSETVNYCRSVSVHWKNAANNQNVITNNANRANDNAGKKSFGSVMISGTCLPVYALDQSAVLIVSQLRT